MRSFITCFFTRFYWGDKIMEDEMGRACSTQGRNENTYKILVGNLKGRDQRR
jgi:hypothetical protein